VHEQGGAGTASSALLEGPVAGAGMMCAHGITSAAELTYSLKD